MKTVRDIKKAEVLLPIFFNKLFILEIYMNIKDEHIDVVCSLLDQLVGNVTSRTFLQDMGDSHMGLQARLMSQALRKLTGQIKNANCLVVFINQIRMK